MISGKKYATLQCFISGTPQEACAAATPPRGCHDDAPALPEWRGTEEGFGGRGEDAEGAADLPQTSVRQAGKE